MNQSRLLALILCLSALWGYSALTYAQDDLSLYILDIDYESQFPEVALSLRYTGETPPANEAFRVEVGEQPVEIEEVTSQQGALAVSIVADLSDQMNDNGMPLNNTRFEDMQSLLQSLTRRLLLPDPLVSLTVFTDTMTVYHQMSNDVGALTNIVSDRVPDKRFVPQASAQSGEGYALEQAILSALEQFEETDPGVPRELVVLAAGDPAVELDQSRLQTAITAASTARSPLTLTVIAFGSGQPGEFASQPANPTALEQLAANNNGRYIHYFDTNINSALLQAVEGTFEQLVQRADRYVLRFTVDEGLSGEQTVRVQVDSVADEISIVLENLPPRIEVVIDSASSSLQGQVQLSVETIFAQHPLTEVEYLLGNRVIGTSQEAPRFPLEINVSDASFQQLFEPGEYDLVAAVQDAQGQVNRSTPRSVRILQSPNGDSEIAANTGWLPIIFLSVGGLVLVGAMAFVGVWWWRARSTGKPQPLVIDDISSAIDDDSATEGLEEDDEKTEEFDERTEEFDDKTVYERRYRVVVVEGVENPSGTLDFYLSNQDNKTHFFIGRASGDSLRQPDIALPHRKVSRQDHAKLVFLAHGDVELIALPSQNGTFFGEEKRKLGDQERVTLRNNDVFWISPAVKLRLEEIQ